MPSMAFPTMYSMAASNSAPSSSSSSSCSSSSACGSSSPPSVTPAPSAAWGGSTRSRRAMVAAPAPRHAPRAAQCRTTSRQKGERTSTSGWPTTTSSAWQRVMATLKRRGSPHMDASAGVTCAACPLAAPPNRVSASSSPGDAGRQEGSDSTVEMNTTRTSWPWKSSTVPTLTPGRPRSRSSSRTLFTCFLYMQMTPMSRSVMMAAAPLGSGPGAEPGPSLARAAEPAATRLPTRPATALASIGLWYEGESASATCWPLTP
mmetsp:Transcript_37262/g.93931  ORF Transcript_37262/g.93931 Transcript_37262/m.93931 type:complete len:261 (-) Transcript_37262:632-1414(-)